MLTFDVETFPDTAALEFLSEPEAPANYKDAEKIAAYKAEARAKQIGKMSLDPALCRIVAMGADLDNTISVSVCPDEDVERVTLQRFWDAWDNSAGLPCGFNVIAFDLPVIITRSRILGVSYPLPVLRKYGSPDVRDLMLELSFGGLVDFHSLKFWVRRLKLDVPEDTTSGKDIAAMVEAGDWVGVAKHCEADVLATTALAKYLDGVRAPIGLALLR